MKGGPEITGGRCRCPTGAAGLCEGRRSAERLLRSAGKQSERNPAHDVPMHAVDFRKTDFKDSERLHEWPHDHRPQCIQWLFLLTSSSLTLFSLFELLTPWGGSLSCKFSLPSPPASSGPLLFLTALLCCFLFVCVSVCVCVCFLVLNVLQTP